jgi:proton-dependent oligopeptide transporter, POT family
LSKSGGQKIGWHYGFGAAAIAMFLGLLVYYFTANNFLTDKGLAPKSSEIETINNKTNPLTWIILAVLVVFILVFQLNGTFVWSSKKAVATSMGIIAVVVVILYFVNLLFASNLNKIEQKRVGILFVLFWGAVLFWAGFEQQGSTLQIFADRHSELPFGIPSSWFQNFNPFYILVFAPVLGSLWVYLEKTNRNPPLLVKFALSLFLLAFGYYIMVVGSKVAVTGVKASALFLTFTYLFHTLGEICLSPVGLSAFTKLAPKKSLSQMMGIWFVATALGNLFAGLFAGGFDEENIQQMPQLFMSIVWFSLIVGTIILALSVPMKKWMGGIE